MTWYDGLQDWLQEERKRAWLEDVIIRAGLAHLINWAQVDRILKVLTRNPWDFSSWITVDELLSGIPPSCRLQLWGEEVA